MLKTTPSTGRFAATLLLATAAALGCNVDPQGADTSGVDLGADAAATLDADAGAMPDAGEHAEALPSTRGFIAINTDYASTSISVVSRDGELLSASILSSASESVGLSAPLSSDVVLPSMPAAGNEAVLLDRGQGQAILSWLNLTSGKVRAQLSVGTGFDANPHDYIEVSSRKAYVSRWNPNLDGGQEDFDGGDDLLIIDPSKPKVTGRINLASALEGEDKALNYHVRPERLVKLGDQYVLSTAAIDGSFTHYADGRLLRIDATKDRVAQVLVLDGLSNCAGLALAPDGLTLAVACAGAWGQDPADGFPDAGVVLVGLDDGELVELDRMPAVDMGGAMLGSIAWATDSHLLFTTPGSYDGDVQGLPDTLRLWNVAEGKLQGKPLHKSKDFPFSLGDVACTSQTEHCVVADAETSGGILHYLEFDSDGTLKNRSELSLDADRGLPPRYLGTY